MFTICLYETGKLSTYFSLSVVLRSTKNHHIKLNIFEGLLKAKVKGKVIPVLN